MTPFMVCGLLLACGQAEAPPASDVKAAVDPAPPPVEDAVVGPQSQMGAAVTITYCIP